MFTTMLRQGLSKEEQVRISNHFNVGLNKQVKRVLALQRELQLGNKARQLKRSTHKDVEEVRDL